MKKRRKKAGQITRLVDLDVDEVSLVDKPAIGEEIYLTKSVEGGKVKLKKKNILKGDEEKPAAAADPKAGEAAANAEDPTKEIDANAEADEAEGEEEGDEAAAAGGEAEEEGEEEDAPAAEGDVAKRLAVLEKNTEDLQEMLATSLDFHEQAAQALNSVVVITMAALEMLVDMSQEDEEAPAAGEGATAEMTASAKAVGELRVLTKKFQEDVQKAGAKISSSRMALLQDIATKLNALISSVSADEGKGGKKGKKKSAVEMESLKQQLVDLKKSFSDVETEKDQLKKQVADQATRLGEIESTAGASAGIGDDEEEDSESETEGDKTKGKSVFAGLIPVADIKERVKKRQDFLGRKASNES